MQWFVHLTDADCRVLVNLLRSVPATGAQLDSSL
jgi:hypothetical protein